MNAKYQNKHNIYGKIVAFFLILVVAAIFTIFHFALAKVTINVYGEINEEEYSALVEMLPENSENLSDESLFGKFLQKELELSATVPSEMTFTPSLKAGGFVKIINNYSQEQILVASTRLLTPDNKLYRLQSRVVVPAGQSLEVWAEADLEGATAESEASKMIIPGLWEGLQDKIYAESQGMYLKSQPNYQVTEASLLSASEKINTEAINTALTEFNALLAENLKINQSRLFISSENVSSSAIGEINPETSLTKKLKIYALVFDEEKLLQISKDKISKQLPSSQKLVEFLPENFTYKILETDASKEQAIIEVKLKAKISSEQHLLDIDKDQLIGKTSEEINQYLDTFDIKEAEVEFFPFWVNKVPKFKDHIIIE